MWKFLVALSCLLLISSFLLSQIGGLNTYQFLDLPASARISGLGENLIAVRDDDANLAYANPALLNASMHNHASFSHSFLFEGIQFGFANYARHIDHFDATFFGGIQYISYGDFDQTDEFGNINASFNASEYAFALGGGKTVYDRLALGLNVKVISSNLGNFQSLGLATDIGATYFDTTSNFTASIVFKNIGTQISTYTDDNQEPLPFEIQLGISKRLRYLPFRFSIVYHHFDRWDILYDDPNTEENNIFFGSETTERSDASIWFDNFSRHFIFNGEFLFGKLDNFRLRFGYNHFRRRELLVDNAGGLAGFSFGIGFKVNRFKIDYGRSTYHIAGAIDHFSISTKL